MESRLYLLFTPSSCRADPWRTLERAIRGGVDLVQWRVAAMDREGATRCREICIAHRVPFVVNDHCALSVDVDADGVHVGQDDTPLAQARAIVGPTRWVGVSTHDVGQVEAATAGGADYLGFGPMFPTATKGYATGQPRGALRAAAAATRLPVFAIGGISANNVSRIVDEGVHRIAVSAAILGATCPDTAARALRAALAPPGSRS